MPEFRYRVSAEDRGIRLDVFLTQQLSKSRSQIQKLIAEQRVLVNGKPEKARYLVEPGDEVSAEEIPLRQTDLEPENIQLDVLYEDSDIIVINKPAGMVVHPGAGTSGPTLVNALLHHCSDLSGIGGVQRPGIVHRLDKDTSGIIVIAKNDHAHLSLSSQFKSRSVTKVYLALVEGTLRVESGEITFPIGRHPRYRHKMHAFKTEPANLRTKHAETHYRVVATRDNRTLLEIKILTGRTHQIRVHLAAIGHPVAGDPLYGSRTGKRQLLHAYQISLNHPSTGERLTFTTPVPQWAKTYASD